MTRALVLCLALPHLWSALSEARSLHWEAVEVDAFLEADGDLRIIEIQEMVFSGDWNGGERRFYVKGGEELLFERVERRDPVGGRWIPLEEGELDAIDHFQWQEGRTLRWRSRLPRDPYFESTHLTYRFHYIYRGVLSRESYGYGLSFDFLFPDRIGAVERYYLNLDLAPEWKADHPMPLEISTAHLEPGVSAPVNLKLTFGGRTLPYAGAKMGQFERLQWVGRGSAILGLLLMLVFWIREGRRRRFKPLIAPSEVDEEFLVRHVFSRKPEEVGAIWDEQVGNEEVLALLARLVHEGKIKSEIVEDRKTLWRWLPFRPPFVNLRMMQLTRLASKRELVAQEFKLLDGIFPGQLKVVDKHVLRKHYRKVKRAFHPARAIRSSLGLSKSRFPGALGAVIGLLFAAAVAIFFIVGIRSDVEVNPLFYLELGLLVVFVAVARFAHTRVAAWIGPAAPILGGVTLCLGALPLSYLVFDLGLGLADGLTRFAFLSVGMQLTASMLWMMWFCTSNSNRERHDLRRHLHAARAYFETELRSSAPRLQDEWLPYLIGLGLIHEIEDWARGFSGTHTQFIPRTSGSGQSSAGSSVGWTGGGGAFVGAGASGSWAAIASSLTSSSSGGSSSGSGGSSGGGGGGGW